MRNFTFIMAAIVSITLAACGGGGGSKDVSAYKAALPSANELLSVEVPTPVETSRVAGIIGPESATFPALAGDPAKGINGFVTNIVTILDAVTNLPYTYYDDEEKSVFWGPYKDDNTRGEYVLMVVLVPETETGSEDGDVYGYNLFRVPDGFDLLANVGADEMPPNIYPILSGMSSPENSGGPIGLVRFDFDENAIAEDAYDGDSYTMPEGVFAAVFGQHVESDVTDTFVLSVVRNFAEPAGGDTADLDYFYGRHEDSTGLEPVVVDYFNFLTEADVIQDTSATETLEIRLAFIDSSYGRAEVEIAGGDSGLGANALECWDPSLNRIWLELDDGYSNYITPSGSTSADCYTPFQSYFDALGIPSISDLGGLYDELETFALEGFF